MTEYQVISRVIQLDWNNVSDALERPSDPWLDQREMLYPLLVV